MFYIDTLEKYNISLQHTSSSCLVHIDCTDLLVSQSLGCLSQLGLSHDEVRVVLQESVEVCLHHLEALSRPIVRCIPYKQGAKIVHRVCTTLSPDKTHQSCHRIPKPPLTARPTRAEQHHRRLPWIGRSLSRRGPLWRRNGHEKDGNTSISGIHPPRHAPSKTIQWRTTNATICRLTVSSSHWSSINSWTKENKIQFYLITSKRQKPV